MRSQIFTRLLVLLTVILHLGGMRIGRVQSVPNLADAVLPLKIVRLARFSQVQMSATEANSAHVRGRIGRIFLDRKRHRLLVQVIHYKDYFENPQSLFWVSAGKIRRCKDWSRAEFPPIQSIPELIAADMNLGLLYYVTGSGIGNGAYLHKVDRQGHVSSSSENPGHLICVVNGKPKGRMYWGLNDWGTDVDLGGWVGEFQDEELLKRSNVGAAPSCLLYLAATDNVLMIHSSYWQSLMGKTYAYPHITPDPRGSTAPYNAAEAESFSGAAIDADAAGQYLYYADRYGLTLYKIRIKDGAVVTARHLPFIVSTLIVDSDANLLHLVDWKNDTLVAVKLF